MVLNEKNSCDYLAQKGFLDMQLLWARCQRHLVLAAKNETDSILVKQEGTNKLLFGNSSLDKEYWFYSVGSAGLSTTLNKSIPRVHFIDKENKILAFQYYSSANPLLKVLKSNPHRGELCAKTIGMWLGKLHSESIALLEVIPAGSPPIHWDAIDEMSWKGYSGRGPLSIELAKRIRKTDGLIEKLNKIESSSAIETLIHGDLKLDNIIWQRGGASPVFKVIDWELCGRGDPHKDIGKVIGGFLSIWIQSISVHRDLSVSEWLRRATVPYSTIQVWIQSFFESYSQESSGVLFKNIDLSRVVEFAALALIEDFISASYYKLEFSAQDLARYQVATNLLREPERLAIQLEPTIC